MVKCSTSTRTEKADEARSRIDRGRVAQLPALQRDNSLSAVSCPICRDVLRVNTLGFEPRSRLTTCPLLVEDTLKNPGGDAAEYQLLLEVRNDSGTLLSRQIIDVGAVKVLREAYLLVTDRDVDGESHQLNLAGIRTSSPPPPASIH